MTDYSHFLENKDDELHLYSELKPSERIMKLFYEFLVDPLEQDGYKFLKSKKKFVKKNGLLEYTISYFPSRRNTGNFIVKFDMCINVMSPKYKNWELKYYGEIDKVGGPYLAGGNVQYLEGWDNEHLQGNWYNLVRFDNKILMESILNNIQSAGYNFHSRYSNLDLLIEELKINPERNFCKIIDFQIINNKIDDAIDFFRQNNQPFEEQIINASGDSQNKLLREELQPYILRKNKISNLTGTS